MTEGTPRMPLATALAVFGWAVPRPPEQVQAKFRELVKRLHPDVNHHAEAEARTIELVAARDTLLAVVGRATGGTFWERREREEQAKRERRRLRDRHLRRLARPLRQVLDDWWDAMPSADRDLALGLGITLDNLVHQALYRPASRRITLDEITGTRRGRT
ncbi:MAG: hypothetical protein ACREKH_06965 [Candidatus Rokuibacteriota bacterium]